MENGVDGVDVKLICVAAIDNNATGISCAFALL